MKKKKTTTTTTKKNKKTDRGVFTARAAILNNSRAILDTSRANTKPEVEDDENVLVLFAPMDFHFDARPNASEDERSGDAARHEEINGRSIAAKLNDTARTWKIVGAP